MSPSHENKAFTTVVEDVMAIFYPFFAGSEQWYQTNGRVYNRVQGTRLQSSCLSFVLQERVIAMIVDDLSVNESMKYHSELSLNKIKRCFIKI